MWAKLFFLIIMGFTITPALSQQLTREIVDNMNRMCGTGQSVSGGLETDINLLKRLGVIGVTTLKTEREIASIIDSIKDEKTKIEALRAIQTCNLEYLKIQGKRSENQRECLKSALAERKHQHTISADKGVRCEGGGPNGKSDYKEDTAAIYSPSGYIFSGAANIKVNSESRGSIGTIVYTSKDGNDVAASAKISCNSPGKIFGPGAFVNITLSASVEKKLSAKDISDIEVSCGM